MGAIDIAPQPGAFYDLHPNEQQLEPQTQRERAATAIRLGYDGVAMVHQAGPRLSDVDKCTFREVALDSLLSAGRGMREALQQAHKRASHHGNGYTFHQLTRINIPTDEANAAQAACSNSAVVGTYDILAVQPQSERAFAQACTSLDVDVISVDLAKRLPYRFKPAAVQAAIARGAHFEILYAGALRDPGSRRQLFANAQALCRETRGRGVVVSSGARTAMELRGPYDVANLATFLGLTQQQAHAAVGRNAAEVLRHARSRKAYRGTLTLRVRSAEEVEQDQAQASQAALGNTSFMHMHSGGGAISGQVKMELG